MKKTKQEKDDELICKDCQHFLTLHLHGRCTVQFCKCRGKDK